MNDAIDKQSKSIKNYVTLRRYNWSISKSRNFMRNLCDAG